MSAVPTAVLIDFDSLRAAGQREIESVQEIRSEGREVVAFKLGGQLGPDDARVYSAFQAQGAPLAGVFTDPAALVRRFPGLTARATTVFSVATPAPELTAT